jgi:hypothetical protein
MIGQELGMKPWNTMITDTTIAIKQESRKPWNTEGTVKPGETKTNKRDLSPDQKSSKKGRTNKLKPRRALDPHFIDPGLMSPQKRKARDRNDTRLDKANKTDQKTLSKYLECNSFVHVMVQGPDDGFTPPNWLMENVRAVAGMGVKTPDRPPVMFQMTDEAARHNTQLLIDHDLDFAKFLQGQQDTTLAYGSEF